MKKSIKILSLLLVLVTLLTSITVPAFALSWDGSTAGGGGNGTSAGANGYAIRYTDNDTNLLGYRFSIVNKSGANKVTKVIDVFRNTYYGNYECDNAYKFTTKYNKKQLINNQNGNYSTSKNSTICYKETNMGFATSLPTTSGMSTWQNNTTNLNKILATLGAGSISTLKNGDKILVEPIYDVRLESVYHALTVTEIAIYGKHILGASSDGGSSSTSASWGFISSYTNKHYPNTLFTPDGQGLWTGVSASSSRLTFYNMINKGYGVGIAYTETKPNFTPALSVLKCEAWPGTLSTRNNNHYGISTGNAFANWSYGHGYPKSGDKIWYAVNFPAETENCYVKQTVWVVGGGSTSRNVWSNDNTWYDVSLNPTTVEAGKSYYTVKARVDWIESNGTVKKNGAEKTFYIPIKPIVTREKVTALNQESVAQAYSSSAGSSGKVYFGQKVTFQYKYGATTTWESSNNITAKANRWNGSSWAAIYSGNTTGIDLSVEKVGLSSTKSCTKNSGIGTYTIPLPAKEDTNSYRLKFDLTTAWVTDTSHTTESSTYYIPVVKSDVELADIKLVDSDGNYVDRNDLTVGDELTIHYFYKNNTDCTVYVKGYNDGGTQISGVYAIPAGGTIEVAGRSYTVPNQRTFNIWGGVYLDTVARGNTDYETDGTNNQWLIVCKSNLPLTLTAIAPNAAYREKTSVISSFRLWNYSDDDYTPNAQIKVRLRIYKNGQTTAYQTLTKDVVVPAQSNNLVYFKWYVPTGLSGKDVTLKADVYDGSKYWNEISNERSTTPYTYYTTPDTRYEEKAPTGFSIPNTPSARAGSAKWSIYEFIDGAFVKKNYAIAIKNDMTNEIEPATGSTATKSDNKWTMKSGYGISLKSCSVMVSVDGYASPDYTGYTVPQYAYAALPEYGYTFASGKAVTLGKTTINSYGYYIFPETGSYGNVHFTPLWYPDGKYTVKVVQRDSWTPAGMISMDLITNTITISGNAYDDWYEGRR